MYLCTYRLTFHICSTSLSSLSVMGSLCIRLYNLFEVIQQHLKPNGYYKCRIITANHIDYILVCLVNDLTVTEPR